MDEKGFLIGVGGKYKRIFSRASYAFQDGQATIQDSNREWITVLAYICADGEALQPALIYQAASGNIQDSWLQDFDPAEHKAFLTSSLSGWTTNEIGFAWLKQVFNRETEAKARRKPRLLIVDGHGSHLTIKFIEFCDAHNILLAILPPHSTHTLQPLDIGLFGPLAGAYSAKLRKFLQQSQGLSAIRKRDFFRLFWPAWRISFVEKTIKKAFATAGIAPFNPKVILSKFSTTASIRPSLSSSITLGIRLLKLTTIELLLLNFQAKPKGAAARKLARAIVNLNAENTLLYKENTGLKEGLKNEKKRRQRAKPLPLQAPENFHGRAIFWSPTKVQQARDRQHQKKLNKSLAQQQKDEATKRKAEKKQLKQQEMELRREIRLQAKEVRAALEAEKQQEKQQAKLQKQLEKQLKNDIQLSQKGKKQRVKPQAETQAKIGGIVDVIQTEEPSEAPAARSRSGRKINLPAKFQ